MTALSLYDIPLQRVTGEMITGRDGAVVARFAPDMTVENPPVLAAIESALSQH